MSGSSNGNNAAAAAAEQLGNSAAAAASGRVVGAGLPALGTGVSSNPSSPRTQPRQQQSQPPHHVDGGSSGGGGGGGGAPRPPPLQLRSSCGGSGVGSAGTPRSSSVPPGALPINNLNHLSDRLGSLSTFSDELMSDDPNAPAKQDFMVSFLVDARGGSMIGCRHSGAKVRTGSEIIHFHFLFPPSLCVIAQYVGRLYIP